MKWPAHQTIASLTGYFRSILRLLARRNALRDGERIHAIILTTGLSGIVGSFIDNSLLQMYSKCGHFKNAQKLFDRIPHSHKDAVDWTTLIDCYTHHKLPTEALSLFKEMPVYGVKPDEVTMLFVLRACAQLDNAVAGDHAIGYVMKMGVPFTLKMCNSMIDMYVKCGLIGEAKRMFHDMSERSVVTWTVMLDGVVKWEGLDCGRVVFDEMPLRNEVAWTIMTKGYVENGFTREAFSLLGEMVFISLFELTFATLCSILTGCTQSGDLMVGRWVHVYALKRMEEEMNAMVGTSLINMYAKCGRINMAFMVFQNMASRNVVTWNAMLSGLAMHGMGNLVLEMFTSMLREAKPDDITMTSVLAACSHSGLVDQGLHYFNNIERVYSITPQMEHYACVVDLLGRAGRLDEAEKLIRDMPIRPNEVILGSLMGSCSIHGKLQLAEKLLQDLVELNPYNIECHVLLSNLYDSVGKRSKANHLRYIPKKMGIRKVPGMSSIHVKGSVHRFSAGDKSHPRSQEIYSMLDEVIKKLRLTGYVPNMASQIFSSCNGQCNAEELEEKEQALFTHSEKLAVCFGLISTKAGIPLYIFKNLRICQDCHSAMKIISQIYGREIIIRDRSRFHSFKQGSCSCSGYW